MTETRRIILNVVASYGRNVFTLVCGLFTGRWVLMSLGELDYGLYGVIGGLMVFIAFINSVLAGSVGRFYAVSVGQAKVTASSAEGIEECRRWFNTALSIHTFVPLVLLLIGYPTGIWAIHHWLVIPPERIAACVWVFRFSCLSGLIGMMSVPFNAMYTAKQYIAELTIYSFATTVLNILALYYMVTHPGEWLTRYALWSCALGVVPQLIICARAVACFPECRLRWAYWYDRARLLQVGRFAGWQMLGCFCGLLRSTGITILVNKLFGPRVNAAQGVAQSVNGHASSLAGAMLGAFMPAITSTFGTGDLPRMRRMAFRACKFGVLLALLFMLPLSLELPEVMRLWLKNPPPYAVGLCWCMIVQYLADVCTQGHMVVVNASGKIAAYHVVLSLVSIFTLPAAYLCAKLTGDVYLSVGGVLVGAIVLNSIGRLIFARALLGMSIRLWLVQIFLPLTGLTVISGLFGLLPQLWLEPSIWRIGLTSALTELALLPLTWCLVLTREERDFVTQKIAQMTRSFLRR